MQKDHTTLPDGLARVPRRAFIATLAASALAAPALASQSCKTSRLSPAHIPPLDEQLDICVANLRNVLVQMHPQEEIAAHISRDPGKVFVLLNVQARAKP